MVKTYIKVLFIVFFFIIKNSILIASIPTNFSTFQEVLVAQPTPVVQLQFPYNLLPNYTTTSISGLSTSGGTVTQGTGMAYLSTNSSTSAVALLASKARVNYQAGQGVLNIFSAIFDTGVANNVQYIGIGNAQDGFFFGYTGTNFGILQRSAGVDTWIIQSSWNGDILDGSGPSGVTLNKQFGNTYKIQYQGLGFGVVKFYVQNPVDGTWILVHTIRYPNSTGAQPDILNPSMQLLAATENGATGAALITLKTGGMMASVEGYSELNTYPRFSANFRKASVTTTNQNILSIMNNTGYAGKDNQTMVFPDMLTIMNPGTLGGAAVIIRLYINPTVTAASYVNVASNSVVSSDAVGTTISGGTQIFVVFLNNSIGDRGSQVVNLSPQKISIAPGDRLVITAQSTAGTLSNISVGISWIEKQ